MIGISRQVRRAVVYTAVISFLGMSVPSGCGSNATQEPSESVALVDRGPNAQLGNNELFAAASSNMKALHSFHIEFTEEPKDLRWDSTLRTYQAGATTDLSSTISINADIQEAAKGSHFKLSYGDVEALGPDQERTLIGMMGSNKHVSDILLVQNEVYASDDGGKGWIHHGPGSAGFVLLPVAQNTLLFGNPAFQSGGPDYVGYLSKDIVLTDGSPRLEEIKGTLTRHVVATLNEPTPAPGGGADSGASMWYERVESFEMWISTDAEPAILQMTAIIRSNTNEGLRAEMDLPDYIPYNLDWKWSRLNEDLGTIEAPTGDALITPSP